MDKIIKISIFVVGLIFIFLGLYWGTESTSWFITHGGDKVQTYTGDCFDRFGNKINGVTCEVADTDEVSNASSKLFISVFFITMGLSLTLRIIHHEIKYGGA